MRIFFNKKEKLLVYKNNQVNMDFLYISYFKFEFNFDL